MDAEADTGTTDTEYEHSGLTAETTYSYRVSAINANGSGPASEEATATTDGDSDSDGVINSLDVDDDNDGLIETATRAELDNMRHNLAGSSYKATADVAGDTTGAVTTEPANCDDGDTNTTISLCGYELATDIDLDGFGSDNVTCDSSNKWSPIGGCGSDGNCGESSNNDDDPFTAILEGNGFTVSNLCIEAVVESPTERHDILGLFGYLDGATVRNLAIAEFYIENSFTGGDTGSNDDNNRLGALVGYVTGNTAILNVAAEDSDGDIDLQGATTDDAQHIGGLVGQLAGGSITASYATGNVDGGDGGQDTVGGLVGRQDGGSITASYATGNANGGEGGEDIVSGLVGWQFRGIRIASYATGNADGGDGGDDFVGGLVGFQLVGNITASYGFGTATGVTDNTIGNSESATVSPWPSGVTSAAGLTADNAGTGWSTDVWDFGDMQAPALLYVDGYTFDDGPDDTIGTDDDTHTYSCANASFPVSLMVSCGATRLPEPAGSPQDS